MFSRSVALYKLQTALASFSVFLFFAGTLAFVTYRFWYPDYLFWLDGGIQGLRLVYAVDFVLGPLMVLVFFHPEKSRGKLIFDVVVVAAVQFSAMVWGAYQVYSQRPIAVVYGSHRFISVAPAIMGLQRKTPESMRVFSDARPPYVYRREPHSEQEKRLQVEMLMKNGFHFESQAWLFESFLPNLSHVFERQEGAWQFIRETLPEAWRKWVAIQDKKEMSAYRFALYEGRYGNALLIFSSEGEYRDYLSLGDAPLPEIKDIAASVDKAH